MPVASALWQSLQSRLGALLRERDVRAFVPGVVVLQCIGVLQTLRVNLKFRMSLVEAGERFGVTLTRAWFEEKAQSAGVPGHAVRERNWPG